MVTAEVDRALAATWSLRHRLEVEAAVRFSDFAARLERSQAPDAIVSLARRAASDEPRHADICADVARRHGASPVASPPALVAFAPTSLSAGDALLYELFATCCVCETVSVATILASLEATTDPTVREALREILADEVNHARLGWAHLEWERSRGRGGFLADWMPTIVANALGEEGVDPAVAIDPVLASFGELGAGRKRAVYRRALEDVVRPGLARAGLSGG